MRLTQQAKRQSLLMDNVVEILNGFSSLLENHVASTNLELDFSIIHLG